MRISDWSSDVCSSDLCLDDRAGAVDPAISALQCISQLGVCKAATKEINCVHFVSPLILHSRSMRARCRAMVRRRSEEHTSELQSLMRISYAVFCLKKKKLSRTQHTVISR